MSNRNDVTLIFASDLTNREDIEGNTCVAGLIAHGYSDSNRSQVIAFSSAGRVYGNHPSHDLFAHLDNIQLIS